MSLKLIIELSEIFNLKFGTWRWRGCWRKWRNWRMGLTYLFLLTSRTSSIIPNTSFKITSIFFLTAFIIPFTSLHPDLLHYPHQVFHGLLLLIHNLLNLMCDPLHLLPDFLHYPPPSSWLPLLSSTFFLTSSTILHLLPDLLHHLLHLLHILHNINFHIFVIRCFIHTWPVLWLK